MYGLSAVPQAARVGAPIRSAYVLALEQKARRLEAPAARVPARLGPRAVVPPARVAVAAPVLRAPELLPEPPAAPAAVAPVTPVMAPVQTFAPLAPVAAPGCPYIVPEASLVIPIGLVVALAVIAFVALMVR